MVAYTVALVGFSQAESSTFESFLRLAARRPPGYRVQDEVMDAQILVVNADNAQALHLVRYADLPGKVLLVGNTDGGTGWPLQRKPVRLVSVLTALDGIVGVTSAAAPAKKRSGNSGFQAAEPYQASQLQGLDASMRRASSRRGADTEFPPTRPMLREARPAPAAGRTGVMRMTDFGGLDDLPSPPAPARRPPLLPASPRVHGGRGQSVWLQLRLGRSRGSRRRTRHRVRRARSRRRASGGQASGPPSFTFSTQTANSIEIPSSLNR